jgi:hypothetical protein
MPLKISIRKNYLPSNPSPYVVRSNSSDVVEFDRFVDLMAKGRTTLTKTDIVAAMQLYREELESLLADGMTVKTPTGSFYACASGCMDSMDESFLPGVQDRNHDLCIHHRPERGFEANVLSGLRIVREESSDPKAPSVQSLSSSLSDAPDSTKPGDALQLRGLRLKFDPADPEEGVFFVDSAGTPTRSAAFPLVTPRAVIALVPSGLAAGTYSVQLRSKACGKGLREGRREGLTVSN